MVVSDKNGLDISYKIGYRERTYANTGKGFTRVI